MFYAFCFGLVVALNNLGQGKDKVIPMKISFVEKTSYEGCDFSLTRTENPAGKNCFTAKASLNDGEIVLFDHWNLSVLKKRIIEWVPLMKMARELESIEMISNSN